MNTYISIREYVSTYVRMHAYLQACRYNRPEFVPILVETGGAHVNDIDSRGWTALMHACLEE
jgi:ankyrin repeat protein